VWTSPAHRRAAVAAGAVLRLAAAWSVHPSAKNNAHIALQNMGYSDTGVPIGLDPQGGGGNGGGYLLVTHELGIPGHKVGKLIGTRGANIKALRDYSTREPRPGHRRIVFRFCTSPVAIKGAGRVEEIVLGRNELLEHDGRVVARDTGERETHPMNLVVRAVGYHGVPVPGLPFDDSRGTIPHTGGKVIGRTNDYVTGWIKRGPSGVIGTNKSDSQDTVENLWEDLTGEPQGEVGADYADELAAWLAERQPLVVTDDHWQQIDAHERTTGEPHGRPRVKVVSVADLLRIAHG
jgi:ferredoxin--NADP+ reductase